jgi:16S rRNA G1207 methylase RsmC
VLPGAFSPKYFNAMRIFAACFPFRGENDFLDIGAGTGIINSEAERLFQESKTLAS